MALVLAKGERGLQAEQQVSMWGTRRFWVQSMPPWGQVTKMDSVRGQELFQMLSNYMATVTA